MRHQGRSGLRAGVGLATITGLVGAGLALVTPTVPAQAATRTEQTLSTSSPIRDVVVSKVSLHLPLPASVGARPEACDWVSYLRFRHRRGPAQATRADRVLVAQPGILEGAGAFDSVARNTITQAASGGRYVEFWALDRRSNCLDDHTGLQAAVKARNPTVAIDYYYNKKSIGGKTFAGHLTNDQVAFLQHVGLEQTLRDQYDVLRQEIPDQAVRKQKVLCGGHSLGGTLTGFFASWDFDGNAATTEDAGFNQCAGYFALDTVVSTTIVSPEDVPLPVAAEAGIDLGAAAVDLGLASGVIPRTLSAPAVVNPETMNLLAIAGIAAVSAPNAQSTLTKQIPASLNTELTYRLLGSRDLGNFVTGDPGLRDFRITNQAALGFLLDDNSMPLAILQTSVGFFDGGPVVDKDFPVGNDLSFLPEELRQVLQRMSIGTELKAVPSDAGPAGARGTGPLYTWRNYHQVGKAGDPAYKARNGQPFTTAAKEVTDIQELGRSLAEYPLDFTEAYFPTRIMTDLSLNTKVASVAKHYLHRTGIAARPTVTILGGDGIMVGKAGIDTYDPVVLPGYQHLDVLTAAPTQNDGRPEQTAVTLAAFARDPN